MLKRQTERIHKREVEILNAHADYFNTEIVDVLRFEAEIEPEELDDELPDECVVMHFSETDPGK